MKLPKLNFGTENIQAVLRATKVMPYGNFCKMVLDSVKLEVPIDGVYHRSYKDRMREIENNIAVHEKKFRTLVIDLRRKLWRTRQKNFIEGFIFEEKQNFLTDLGIKYWPTLISVLKASKNIPGSNFPVHLARALRLRGKTVNLELVLAKLDSLESRLKLGDSQLDQEIALVISDSLDQAKLDFDLAEKRETRRGLFLVIENTSTEDFGIYWPQTVKILKQKFDADFHEFMQVARKALTQESFDQNFNGKVSGDDLFVFIEKFEFTLSNAQKMEMLKMLFIKAHKYDAIRSEQLRLREFRLQEKKFEASTNSAHFLTEKSKNFSELTYVDKLDAWYGWHTGGER